MADNTFTNIIYSLIATGVIIILCTIGTSSSGAVTGTMVGYSFILVGICSISVYSFMELRKMTSNLWPVLFTIGPILAMIGIIIYMLYLLGTYFNRITTGNVSNGYSTFSNIIVILVLMQIAIFYNETTKKQYQDTKSISKVGSMIILLLDTINIISVITLGTILKDYITDG